VTCWVTAAQVRAGSGVVLFVIGGAALLAGGDLYGAAIALVAYQCIAEYYGFLKNMGKGKGKVRARSLYPLARFVFYRGRFPPR